MGKGHGFWPKEMKIAGQMLKKYTPEFLLWCPIPNGYKVNSLVWFLTVIGQNYLSDKLVEYTKLNSPLFKPKEPNKIGNTKIGEDVIIRKTPKNLSEFLKYYGEK
jgi:hypothetical protein